jgi:hypothetical protein
VAGTAPGWISEDIQESIMKSFEKDTTSEAQAEAGLNYTQGRDAAVTSAADAVDRAVLNNQSISPETADDLRRAARLKAGLDHSDGAQWRSESSGS